LAFAPAWLKYTRVRSAYGAAISGPLPLAAPLAPLGVCLQRKLQVIELGLGRRNGEGRGVRGKVEAELRVGPKYPGPRLPKSGEGARLREREREQQQQQSVLAERLGGGQGGECIKLAKK